VRWRLVNSSITGTSHLESGALCQDVSIAGVIPCATEEEVLVAVASDGAGSASLAHIGAATACSVAYENVRAFLARCDEAVDFTSFNSQQLLDDVRLAITERAEIDGMTTRDYACTLLLAAVGDMNSMFLQIGDGAIVIVSQHGQRAVFWPEAGEYANMTYFVTDEGASAHLQVSVVPDVISEVAVFTDGLQRLALRYDERRPHDPFFAPLFQSVRTWTASHEGLVAALVTWMESDAVNNRTDDDKTIILGVRLVNGEQALGHENPV